MPDTQTIILRLSLALVAGAIIGLEREYRDKSAGLRTLILITLGSCLFTLISLLLTSDTMDRIVANVVTGIGFIGGGVIFKSRKGINGLTTAATIWMAAAIGMAIGAGFYYAAGFSLLATFIILSLFYIIETWIDKLNREREYKLEAPLTPHMLDRYQSIMLQHGLQYRLVKRTRTKDTITAVFIVRGSQKKHEQFIDQVMKDEDLITFTF